MDIRLKNISHHETDGVMCADGMCVVLCGRKFKFKPFYYLKVLENSVLFTIYVEFEKIGAIMH